MLTEQQLIDAIPVKQEGWTDEQVFIWYGRFIEGELTKQLKDFVSSDATAISFQSLGQYRTAILKMLNT
jgi:hypothetical protein